MFPVFFFGWFHGFSLNYEQPVGFFGWIGKLPSLRAALAKWCGSPALWSRWFWKMPPGESPNFYRKYHGLIHEVYLGLKGLGPHDAIVKQWSFVHFYLEGSLRVSYKWNTLPKRISLGTRWRLIDLIVDPLVSTNETYSQQTFQVPKMEVLTYISCM